MSPGYVCFPHGMSGFPRVSGDELVSGALTVFDISFSPCERG